MESQSLKINKPDNPDTSSPSEQESKVQNIQVRNFNKHKNNLETEALNPINQNLIHQSEASFSQNSKSHHKQQQNHHSLSQNNQILQIQDPPNQIQQNQKLHLETLRVNQENQAQAPAEPVHPPSHQNNPQQQLVVPQQNGVYQVYQVPPEYIERPSRHRRSIIPFLMRIVFLLIVLGLTSGIIFLCLVKYSKKTTQTQEYLVPNYFESAKDMSEVSPQNKQKSFFSGSSTVNSQRDFFNNQNEMEDMGSNDKFSEKAIVMKKGSKYECAENQLLLNGNCLSCQEGQMWIGLDCVSQRRKHKHRQRYYY